jgi:hypothetical protein
MPLANDESMLSPGLAEVGDRALERASGAPASVGNAVKLLLDAEQNFAAWLDAIRRAERTVFFEMYIFADDEVGKVFADALAERAREGVYVCVVYDWLGSSRMRTLTSRMRAAGVHVRVFNPPRPTARSAGSRATIARRSRSTARSASSAGCAPASAGSAIRPRSSSRGAIPASSCAVPRWRRSSTRSRRCGTCAASRCRRST